MPTYSISDVSKRYHLPQTTLRYYEDLGLLYDVPRRGNHRVYNDAHLARLSAICCFKNTGMTLSELQTLFSYDEHSADMDKIIDLLDRHCREVDEKLRILEQNHRQIKRKRQFYEDIRTARETHQPLPKWADYKITDF